MQAPASATGDIIELKKVNGALLHITAHELVANVQTKFGPSDAVRADVAVLDGPEKGTIYHNALFFPAVLRRQLEPSIGKTDNAVLGRLGQGTAKSGQDAPWILNPPTAEDMATGTKYEAYAEQQAQAQAEPF